MNSRVEAVARLEAELGHVFVDRSLLERALTHSSVGEGAKRVGDNERLEFLGDRILGLLVAERLIEANPEAPEGELSRLLHAVVRKEACAAVSRRLHVGPALRLAAGETKTGGRDKDTILGDACEALIAAVYLDAGLDKAREVFGPLFDEQIRAVGSVAKVNPKSALQEWAASKGLPPPAYAVVDRTGPDHAPTFTVEVRVEGLAPFAAQGRSRQEAEKAAATAMLDREGLL